MSSACPPPSSPRVALDATDRLLCMLFQRSVRRVSLGLCLTAGCLSPSESSDPAEGELVDSKGQHDAGSDGGGDEPDQTELMPFPCGQGGDFDWQLDEWKLAFPVDYIALKNAFEGSTDTYGERGVACRGASDVDACKARKVAAEAALLGSSPCTDPNQVCGTFYLITTQGEQTRIWQGPEMATLLGTIEHPTEANLLLILQGPGSWRCDDILLNSYQRTPNGIVVRVMDYPGCDEVLFSRLVRPDGQVEKVSEVVHAYETCTYGRRPDGLRSEARSSGIDSLASFFGHAAHLEAASVPAFDKVARELEALGAAPDLIRKAWQARADEVRHAVIMGDYAQRFGAEIVPVEVEERPLRSAFELALDNAVEGCVHETFAALVATFQAEHARDSELRTALATIAEDETRHAGLAWQIADWLMLQLSVSERARIHEAQRAAVEALRRASREPRAPELYETAGVPSPAEAEALVRTLESSLWRDALLAGDPQAVWSPWCGHS